MPYLAPTAKATQYGRRLIPQIIDERAESEPTKTYASFPRSQDVSKGFYDVTYKQFANAINRAAWWLQAAMGNARTCETFAYFGPNDLRYPIFIVAAMKCGYKALLPSPRNNVEYQQSLLQQTGCETILCARFSISKVRALLGGNLNICCELVPELAELLDIEESEKYPYEKTYDEACKDPFLVLHTSGSTGPPKPIVFTVECTTTEDAHRLLPEGSGRLWWHLFEGCRYFLGMPSFHSAGVWFELFMPIYFDSTVVFGFGERPVTVDMADGVHRYGDVRGGFYPPSILEDISKSPSALKQILQLDFMVWGGGPLAPSVGNKLSAMTVLHNFIGFTEASGPPRFLMEPENWNYFQFHPASGFRAEYHQDDLYKLLIHRVEEKPCVQMVFRLFPDLEVYETGDLISKHPANPNLWTHRGRVDDLIVLSTGEKFNPVPMEVMIQRCPIIRSAIVTGNGRFQAALLVETNLDSWSEVEEDGIKEQIWTFVKEANTATAAHGKIVRSLFMLAPPEKPFQRSTKGTIQRRVTIADFTPELNDLYLNAGAFGATKEVTATNQKRRSMPFSKRLSIAPLQTLTPLRSRSPTLFNPTKVTSPVTTTSGDFKKERTSSIIHRLVSEACEIANLNDTDDFFELGMDSLQASQILGELKMVLSLASLSETNDLDLKLLYTNSTVDRLTEAVLALENPSTSHVVAQVYVPQGYEIDDLVALYSNNFSMVLENRPLTIILTGSTGSLGSYLLDNLLRKPYVSKVICLNRSADGAKSQAQVDLKRGLSNDRSDGRVEFLQVDLSKPDLGLSLPKYAMLLRHADHIIHNAWKLDFNQTIKSYERSHIAGVRHLIDLSAYSEKKARIWFVSSIAAVFKWDARNGKVPATIISDKSVVGDNGYAQSKYVAEQILHEASKAAGVPVSIVRVGQIAGPTTAKGMWNKQDWLPILIQTSKAMGQLPKNLGAMNEIDWIPVDRLADVFTDFVEADSKKPGSHFQVYHTVNPQKTSWSALLPSICHRLPDCLELVTFAQWLSSLQELARGGADVETFPALKLLNWFVEQSRAGGALPQLDLKESRGASETLDGMWAVHGKWMDTWMEQWGL